MVIVGQGALARPDGAAVLAASWRLAAHRRADAGLARVQRAAHGRRPGRGARSRLPAGAGRQGAGRRCWAAASICSGCWARTSSTPPHRRRHVRRLSGPPRRPRRRAGGRDPAGRGLHREERHLCEHRGPRAARLQAPCQPPGEAGRIGRSCGRSRRGGQAAALRHIEACEAGWSRSIRCSPPSLTCRASVPTTGRAPETRRR